MPRKFIHFCTDEKFLNIGMRQFDKAYPYNVLAIYNRTRKEDLVYIDKSLTVEFVTDIKNYFRSLPNDAILFFHCLPDVLLPFLKYLPNTVKTIWFIYGYEMYDDKNFYPSEEIFDTKTLNTFYKTKKSFKLKLREDIWPFNSIIRAYYRRQKRNKIKRIDYFGFGYQQEYETITKKLNLTRPMFNFMYYPLNYILDTNIPLTQNKTSILIGHSGVKTVNHLDVVSKLRALGIQDENLIIPLSYGDKDYITHITPNLKLQGNHVEIITEFLPLEKYNAIISQAKVAIFNMRRQQGVGNIIALLYLGTKVFLSEKNSFYYFLKRNKITVFSYEREMTKLEIGSELPWEIMKSNRDILSSLFDQEYRLSLLKKSVEEILQ